MALLAVPKNEPVAFPFRKLEVMELPEFREKDAVTAYDELTALLDVPNREPEKALAITEPVT